METLSNIALEQLEEKLNKEKILFWKDETHIYLQRKKIVFLYLDYESLNIHIKIMTEDGWLFERNHPDHKIKFLNKNTKQKHEYIIAEFRKNL